MTTETGVNVTDSELVATLTSPNDGSERILLPRPDLPAPAP